MVSGCLLGLGFGADEVLAVVAQFFDAFDDVIECFVGAFFCETFVDFGAPAAGKFFQGGNVEVSVVEIGFQCGHVLGHKAAVLADGVAAHGAGARGQPFGHKTQQALFDVFLGKNRGAHTVGQTGARVGGGTPFVHTVEHGVALVHGIDFGLGEDVQVFVSNDHRHFDDFVGIGIKSGHFHIEPAEVVGVLHSGSPVVERAEL